jgi:predicted Fe-Mo cluster-binding NifX family protein
MKKVAFPSNDSQTIHHHLGEANLLMVAHLEDQNPAPQFEQRVKTQIAEECGHHQPIFRMLSDCQVVIAGSMCRNAFKHLNEMGLEVILTGETDIHQALDTYRRGEMVSETERIIAGH